MTAQMGVYRNRRRRGGVEGEATDENVEEEDIWFGNGEEESTGVARGAKGEQLLGESGGGGDVETVAIENELSMGLSKVRAGA